MGNRCYWKERNPVGAELRRNGIKAIVFILLGIFVYIGLLRFDFFFAPGAIIALIHDLIITIGLLSMLGVEFNLTIVAGLMTIAGYSVNDTIIVFDRIREKGKLINHDTVSSVINLSLTETLSRTLVTALTTLVAVALLFAVAGGDIRDFAMTFGFGVIVGTYSSIYVASPLYLAIYRRWGPKR